MKTEKTHRGCGCGGHGCGGGKGGGRKAEGKKGCGKKNRGTKEIRKGDPVDSEGRIHLGLKAKLK